MQMQLPGWLATVEFTDRPARSEFASFLDEQTDLFIESMQDAADNHWQLLQWQMNGADLAEISLEMERWWGHQTRRFRRGLKEEYRRDRERRKNRRLRREIRLRRVAENNLRSTEIELEHTRVELEGERGLRSFLEGQFLCRKCDSRSWD